MRQGSVNRGFPAGNPIANVLVMIVGAVAIIASIVLGFFAFIFLIGVVLVMAAVIGVRVWWLNRKLRQSNSGSAGEPGPRPSGGVIEGEFVVVEKDEDKT